MFSNRNRPILLLTPIASNRSTHANILSSVTHSSFRMRDIDLSKHKKSNTRIFFLAGAVTGVTASIAYQSFTNDGNENEIKNIKNDIFITKLKTLDQISPSSLYREANFMFADARQQPASYARQPQTDIDFDHFGGNEDVLDAVADYVRYLQNPEAFAQIGATMPKGTILSGPPGVGKTMLAEVIAGQAGVPILMVDSSGLVGTLIGESEKNIRNLFEEARRNAPCVLCFDEIESLANKRFHPPKQGIELSANNTVNQLLTLVAEENKGIIIIATTNNYDNIDPAFIRPGRFDRHIEILMPSQVDREKILNLHLKNKKLSDQVTIKDLVHLSAGFSPAMIKTWINEAAIHALREKSLSLRLQDFEIAQEMIESGSVSRSCVDLIKREKIARHEAGHAIAGHFLGKKLYKVTTKSYSKASGITKFYADENTKIISHQEALDNACIALAGRAAEIISGETYLSSGDDIHKAKIVAQTIVDQGLGSSMSGINELLDIENILVQQRNRAINLLEEHKKTWQAVTNALVEHQELSRDDFLKIVDGQSITTKSGFISSDNHNQNKLQLPEKSHYGHHSTSALFNQVKMNDKSNSSAQASPHAPSIQDVSKVLDLDADRIRSIDLSSIVDGGYVVGIIFKPSFKDHEKAMKVSQKLKEAGISNDYSNLISLNPRINVWSGEKFVNFMKEKTQISELSLEEISKALEIDPSSIKTIFNYGNSAHISIRFSDSFNNNAHMEKMSKVMKENDIENTYIGFRVSPELTIFSTGRADFVKFVKERNEDKPRSNIFGVW